MWRSDEEMLARVHRQATARQRRRRRRIFGGAGASLAIVSVMGVSLALASSGGPQRKLRTVGRPTVPSSTTSTLPAVAPTTTAVLPAAGARPTRSTSTIATARPTERIAYATVDVSPQRGVPTIHTVDPTGGRDQLAIRDGAGPAWSPDHTKLAFTRRAMSGADQLFVADADGSHERLLLAGDPNSAGPGNPTWSPDSRQIAFIGLPISGPSPNGGQMSSGQIAIVNADGTRPRRLTNESKQFLGPTWSPDGLRLAFLSSDVLANAGPTRMEVINADGSGRTILTTLAGQAWSPSWSPDGKSIAFTSNRTGSSQIYVMNADGTVVRALTDGPGANADPSWSPDGAQIAYESDRDFSYAQEHPSASVTYSLTKIYVMDADGSSQRRVTDGSQDIAPAWR